MKTMTIVMTMNFQERDSGNGERAATHRNSSKESQVIIIFIQSSSSSCNPFFFCIFWFFPFITHVAFSAELVSELGDSEGEVEYRGLRIHSQPRGGVGGGDVGGGVGGGGGGGGGGAPTRTRVRHNSDGNYDDVSLMQETILRERGEDEDDKEEIGGGGLLPRGEVGEDRVYQNLAFHRWVHDDGIGEKCIRLR